MIKKDTLYKITAASLEKYLLLNDWVRDYGFPNRKLMVFHLDDETIAMPSCEKYKDFYISLPDILETLSDIYDKSSKEIVKEITSSYFDLLEFRIVSRISEDGELPLGYASKCIEGIKELILYSACAEQNQEPICLRTTNNAKEILDNFKLAQTDTGSFIINIDIKVVNEENEQLVLPNCEPEVSVEHKIVKRIGTAIQQIDKITKDQISMDEMLPTAYKSGITANMCDALIKLRPDNVDANIETKIRYASAISQKTNDMETVEIKGNHFFVMGEIAKRYRSVKNIKQTVIRGNIKSLDKILIANQRYKRMITLIGFVDGKERAIKAELGEEDHKIACNAFRDECSVEIRGVLDMSNKIWEMRQVGLFEIINV